MNCFFMLRPALLSSVLLVSGGRLSAQVAPAPATDAATLARYDTNRNGRLDPEENRAMEADRQRLGSNGGRAGDETVVLSPFEVVSDNRGYFATNTMSGTRLNTKLEDLASSITVITKEQMSDFAMLDINDVFLYAGNTEGTGTYTEFNAEDGNGSITDSVAGDPANANRVRGIGNANVSNGNFETSNRVPIDPIDSDGIEISRGPNANIFGLGNASGTVNIISAAANLRRNRATVSFRADSFDGYRASFDINRALLPDKLGVRVSAVRQRDGFDLKPSGVDTERYNGMVQFRPFKRTTINASFQYYRAQGNRPNSLPPLDGISDWQRITGGASFDPITDQRKLNGVVVGTAPISGVIQNTPGFIHGFVEPSGLVAMMASTGISDPINPMGAQQTTRRLMHTRAAVQDTQPLIARRTDMISDQDIYDWSSINLNAPNRFLDQTETSRVTLDQIFFDTGRQSLAGQFGWFREDSERHTRYIMADGATNGPTGQLVLDINERLLDGSPSPYFMRPFLQQVDPRPLHAPLRNDTYRGQFAYKIDFTAHQDFRRWLGAHSLVGYTEYKDKVQRTYRFFEAMMGDQPWLFNADGTRSTFQRLRAWYRIYVGDEQGQDVDYAPGNPTYGDYTFRWGNADTRVFHDEPIRIGTVPNNANGSRSIQKTNGVILQSRFLNGRVIPTFGIRDDQHYTKFQNDTRTANNGFTFDYEYMNHWQPGDWEKRDGRTRQSGVVVKPFHRVAFVEQRANQRAGATRLWADALRGLSLHYNESDSFRPAAPAQNVFQQWLPDPAGKGKDYGFSLNLFDGKFVLRVNKYETRQLNSRSGASAGFARVVWSIDYLSTNFGLQQEATAWITQAAAARGQTLTPAQLNAELERVMGIPPRDPDEVNAIPASETDDILGRGHEIELHFNPTNYWTVQAAFTEKESINTRLAPNVSLYLQQRLPYWTSIVDPRTNELWWTTLYAGAETPFQLFRRTVANPLAVAQATEGLVRPQVRRYGANVSTNLRLAGLTDHSILKRFNIGGALRYESKGAIGYYGVEQLPAIITAFDVNRPIWDKGHVYVDGFIGYRTRLWSDKIGATFQLNVRNIQESGRLQPISAGPDGEPNSFRIVAPRQFILSATFDL
jgi:hypothetical protein